uniref:uncharacterized protein LOC124069391 n=1 Tax=Scatophagus argus TaxID=75038 RepID=UPI001ED7D2A0|nr:uncharacterized protein LOC124069391 [Scatophagus argus]
MKTRQILFKMLSVNFSLFVTLCLLTIRGVSCEDLSPVKDEQSSLEDSSVTLSYRYSKKATGSDNFFWYRQDPGKPPEFLTSHSGTGTILMSPKSGLSVTVSEENTHMNVQISSAAVTDSALYYCAVRPTVTANPQSLYKNTKCKGQDKVNQPTEDVIATEGDSVTLGCTFETSDRNPYLYWYKQEANGYPKYMLKCFSKTVDHAPEFEKDRFNATIENKSVPLKIQKLQLSDSAVMSLLLLTAEVLHGRKLFDSSCEHQTKHNSQNLLILNIQFQPFTSVNMEKLSAVLFCLVLVGNTLEDQITANRAEVTSSEGLSVTLSCNYSVKAENLQWYRQDAGSALQFLLLITDAKEPSVVEATPPHPGLTVNLNEERNRVDLQISSAAVTDSAVYYCALRPTVTGNTKTLYKNLWSKDNRILHNIH